MLVTESGMVTEVSELQSLKAWFSMLVTELGMVTEVSELQPLKAESPMLVTESGISACPDASTMPQPTVTCSCLFSLQICPSGACPPATSAGASPSIRPCRASRPVEAWVPIAAPELHKINVCRASNRTTACHV